MLACGRVLVASIRDLNRRIGQPPPHIRPNDLAPFLRHALRTDPDGFRVATVGGKVVAFAMTILRGRWHFLCLFFTLPGTQSHGIGRPVLARAFEDPRPPRGAVRCVVASPDLRAQALYLKFGMLPRTVLYTVSGSPRSAVAPPDLALRQVGPAGKASKAALALAAHFDRRLRGARRDADLRLLFSVWKGTRMFEARRRGTTVGYVMIRGTGAIGPIGVVRASFSGPLLAAAIAKARELGLKKVLVWIPGLNEGALRAAFAAGLKVDYLTTWMAAEDIGDLAAYVPANGLLF